MRKKNDIETELDQKEFENEINRDLSHQYNKIEVKEKLTEGKNPYVLGGMNFFVTLVILEIFYWVVKANVNFFTLGFSLEFFGTLDPFIHIAILVLCVNSVIQKRSVLDSIIDRWPF
ncbi:MAG: hypothetical protein CL666_05570 [Balneola sp.]|nr:hypothetical protein [Balneola sp.]|tara:strand:- start:212687 stop:213037 length:351 start_codon:yes stop_codon:yes gene_type:complete